MRITALKLVLAVISVSAVMVLGAGRAAAPPPDPCPDPIFHLRTSGGNLVLDTTAPGVGTANFLDSPGLSRAGGNPYRVIGEWKDGYVGDSVAACALEAVGPLHVWLGLRNSDDQGTNFDLRAEVYFKGSDPNSPTILVAAADQLCIKGVTRNPAQAQEIIRSLPLTESPVGDGEFLLKLYARIGTPQNTCAGHNSATGLRVYYNSADRDARFDMFFFDALCS
jgi:hypothetical protein